jgi:CBS domain-containing protein
MPTCSEVMTRGPVSCELGDSVSRAAELMARHAVGCLPVVDSASSCRLVGVVSLRDLVIRVVAGSRAAEAATVADAMTINPCSCREDDDLERAITLMDERRLRRMPIVDADGRLVGVLGKPARAERRSWGDAGLSAGGIGDSNEWTRA